MTIDIIIPGFISNLWVKRRTKKYFCSERYIKRNNVFVDSCGYNTYHVQKKSIHIFVASEEPDNIQDICDYLDYVIRDNVVGIKTNDLLYKGITEKSALCMLRM